VAMFVVHHYRDRYPRPQVTGSYTIAGGGELQRGSVLQVGNEGAALDLGDYCRLNLDPKSVVRLKGEPRHERIFLEQGSVLCDVDSGSGHFAVETDLCTASVKGTRFIVRLDEPKGDTPMLNRQAFVKVFAGAVLVSGAWGQDVLRAAEEKRIAPAAEAPAAPEKKDAEDAAAARKAALKGFRGFIVGHVVDKSDTGVTFKVKAITLLEGCTAEKPGILLGQKTPIVYVTEKDEQGNEVPAKRLADAVAHIEKMPAIAFGGMGGGNAVVVMGGGDEGMALPFVGGVATTTMTMRIDGAEIQIGGGKNPQDPDARKPAATARVQADEEGNLIVDRIMPGGQTYAAWDAMPMLRFAKKPAAKKPMPAKPKPDGKADF